MVLKALTPEETLAIAKAMGLSREYLLLAADRLAKIQEIAVRPFPLSYYSEVKANFRTKKVKGKVWCRTCGTYVNESTMVLCHRADGSR